MLKIPNKIECKKGNEWAQMFEVLITWCPFKKLYKIVQKLTYLVSLRLSVIGRYIWCRCIKKKESYDWVISFIHVIDSNISKFCRNTLHLIASTFELFSNFITPTVGLLVIPCKSTSSSLTTPYFSIPPCKRIIDTQEELATE